jgi:hypothetical protein
MKGRLQVKFLDHYHDNLYEWQDFHECAHFLLAGMAAESSVSTVTQAHIPVIFAVPPTFSIPPPAAIVIKMEDTMSILQDTLQRMESMFASAIYQNTQGAPQSRQYTPPVKGHSFISLLPLSSPTLPLSICIPHPHLCTISKDHTHS